MEEAQTVHTFISSVASCLSQEAPGTEKGEVIPSGQQTEGDSLAQKKANLYSLMTK